MMNVILFTEEWVTTVNGILGLITGALGLITAGIGVFFAVKNFIKLLKEKNAKEIWNLIMNIADAAMKEAEASGKDGATKKQMVINIVKASCKEAGLDSCVEDFLDQLNDYIDSAIKFANDMNKK